METFGKSRNSLTGRAKSQNSENREIPKKKSRTNVTFWSLVVGKQESSVYLAWLQLLFSVIHDPFAPSRSSYRETH